MDRKIRKDRAEGTFIEKCQKVLDELDRDKLDVADKAFLYNCDDPRFFISLDKNSFLGSGLKRYINRIIHHSSVF